MRFVQGPLEAHTSKKDLAQGKYIMDVGDSDHESYRLAGCEKQPDGKLLRAGRDQGGQASSER